MAYTAHTARATMARIAEAMRVLDAAAGVDRLASNFADPMSLAERGFDCTGIDRVADPAAAKPYSNPSALSGSRVAPHNFDAHTASPGLRLLNSGNRQ